MSTPWLHPKITKAEAEDLLLGSGEDTKGKYLVRRGKSPQKFVLSIMFKGKPTHHMCSQGDDGYFTVNNKSYDSQATTIKELIEHLQTKPEGWPVRLRSFVPGPTESHEPSTVLKDISAMPWLHERDVNKAKAEDLLKVKGNQHGLFLVRKHKDEGKYILSVVYKGNPTHHLCDATTGPIKVNKKQIGEASTLQELINVLQTQDIEGWPVKLTDYVSAAPDQAPSNGEPPVMVEVAPSDITPEAAPTEETTTTINELEPAVQPVTGPESSTEDPNYPGIEDVAGGYTQMIPTDSAEEGGVEGYIDVEGTNEPPQTTEYVVGGPIPDLGQDSSSEFIVPESEGVYEPEFEPEPEQQPLLPNTIRLRNPPPSGYGIQINNYGSGHFVHSVAAGSPAEAALQDADLSIDSGLRVSTINGMPIHDLQDAGVSELVTASSFAEICFELDPENYEVSKLVFEGKPMPLEHQLYLSDEFEAFEGFGDDFNTSKMPEMSNPVFQVPAELHQAPDTFDWQADTAFSEFNASPAPNMANFSTTATPGFIGMMDRKACDGQLVSARAGAYVIRQLPLKEGKGYEVVVKHVANRLVHLKITERRDGRLEYQQRLYYRLRDVMYEVERRPLVVGHGHNRVKLEVSGPYRPGFDDDITGSKNLAKASVPGLMPQNQAGIMEQMVVNPALISLGR